MLRKRAYYALKKEKKEGKNMGRNFDSLLEKLAVEMLRDLSQRVALDEREELEKSYLGYLKRVYAYKMTEYEETGKNPKELFFALLGGQKRFWQDCSSDEMKALLFSDEAYRSLEETTEVIFDLALKRIRLEPMEELREEQYEEMKGRLTSLIGSVRDFNREDAAIIHADAIVELEYAFGKSSAQSTRLSLNVLC